MGQEQASWLGHHAQPLPVASAVLEVFLGVSFENQIPGPGLMGAATRVITSEITSMERDAFAGPQGHSTVASGYKA